MEIPQVFDIEMFIAANHENITTISKDALSGTMQRKGSRNQSRRYFTSSFSDTGSANT